MDLIDISNVDIVGKEQLLPDRYRSESHQEIVRQKGIPVGGDYPASDRKLFFQQIYFGRVCSILILVGCDKSLLSSILKGISTSAPARVTN